jgi:LytS/YehU family sensor histidine kinase
MGLQPLVENAIQHGINRKSAAGLLQITAFRSGDSAVIEIRDDGPGLSGDTIAGTGIGLTNTRARLEQLYGKESSLTVENGSPCGTLVTMTIPYRLASETTHCEVMDWHAANYADR